MPLSYFRILKSKSCENFYPNESGCTKSHNSFLRIRESRRKIYVPENTYLFLLFFPQRVYFIITVMQRNWLHREFSEFSTKCRESEKFSRAVPKFARHSVTNLTPRLSCSILVARAHVLQSRVEHDSGDRRRGKAIATPSQCPYRCRDRHDDHVIQLIPLSCSRPRSCAPSHLISSRAGAAPHPFLPGKISLPLFLRRETFATLVLRAVECCWDAQSITVLPNPRESFYTGLELYTQNHIIRERRKERASRWNRRLDSFFCWPGAKFSLSFSLCPPSLPLPLSFSLSSSAGLWSGLIVIIWKEKRED